MAKSESKTFKSPSGRYGTYIGKPAKENHVQFEYHEYQTGDPRIIKGLMDSPFYGIWFSLIEEFPVYFSKYQSKSRTDKGNAQIINSIIDENKDMKAKNDALEKKLAELKSSGEPKSDKPAPDDKEQ